jgi:hypothetical protein
MNKRILVAAVAVASLQLVGCSSTADKNSAESGAGINPGASAMTPIADQRLAASEFKKQGVRVYYSLFGNLEAIEVTGYAAVWGGSMNSARESYRIAELEAKKSLNDFINKESIATTTSVKMISSNLEHAMDNNTNKFSTNKPQDNNSDLVAVDEEVVRMPGANVASNGLNQQENAAIRNNALKIASNLQTTITNNNRGILGGLYLKESSVIDDGRAVKVVMRWDKKHNEVRKTVRNLMAQ